MELNFGRKNIFFTILYRSPAANHSSTEFANFLSNFINLHSSIKKENPYVCFFTGANPYVCFFTGANPYVCFFTGANPYVCFFTGANPYVCFFTGANPYVCFFTGANPYVCFFTGANPYVCFFTGDFNSKSQLWWPNGDTSPEGTEIENLLTRLGLTQVITEPTNFEPNKNPSCIDLVITDQPNPSCIDLVITDQPNPSCIDLVITDQPNPSCIDLVITDQPNPSCIDLVITDQPNLILDSGTRPSLDSFCHHQIIYCKANIYLPPPPPYEREIWHYHRANATLLRRSISLGCNTFI